MTDYYMVLNSDLSGCKYISYDIGKLDSMASSIAHKAVYAFDYKKPIKTDFNWKYKQDIKELYMSNGQTSWSVIEYSKSNMKLMAGNWQLLVKKK